MKSPEEFASEVSESVLVLIHALKGMYLGLSLAGGKSRVQNATQYSQFSNFAINSFMNGLENSVDQLDDISPERLIDYKKQMRLLATSVSREYLSRVMGTSLAENGLAKNESGSLGLLAQARAALSLPKAEDTAGRKWEAVKLAAVVSRDFAYQSLVDSFYDDWRLGNMPPLTIMVARHLVTNDVVFLQADNQEQRDKLFHFNSNYFPEVRSV